jgi:hypothetical protein
MECCCPFMSTVWAVVHCVVTFRRLDLMSLCLSEVKALRRSSALHCATRPNFEALLIRSVKIVSTLVRNDTIQRIRGHRNQNSSREEDSRN